MDLNDLYEDKIRKIILHLVDKIDLPTFYDHLVGILDMWNEIRNVEDTLKPIVKKWSERDKDISLMCMSIIHLSCEKIEKNF